MSDSQTEEFANISHLAGGGEMGALMRALDWSATDLGPADEWPVSLRTAVSICLSSRFPMLIWWGPKLNVLYNDAYIPIFAGKHPDFLGKPGKEAWPEIWDVIGPMLERDVRSGHATWSDDQRLFMHRSGYLEETYFTWSYSPIWEDGSVGGVFTAAIETTNRVLGSRRLRTLRELGANTTVARETDAACRLFIETLRRNPEDVPFALFYLLSPDGKKLRIEGRIEIPKGHPAAPAEIDLETASNAAWPVALALGTKQGVPVHDLVSRFGPLPGGPWEESPNTAIALPVASLDSEQPAGLLILGVSPRREFDDEYRGFMELVAGHLATAISNASAHEREKKRAEALAELDRAKTDFFSNVSHELRTPLTLTLGPLEEEIRESEGPRERLEIAYRNSLRLLKLVNTLLDFSRIEAGRIEAVYEPTDLGTLTAELAGVFRSAIEKAGLRLVVDTPSLPDPVYVDREMWEKIVLNLLGNAFKFTFDGEIAISLRRVGETAELVVRDTGVGIPPEILPRIFERFQRVKGSRSRSYEGTGIGLALVRELVRLHGGDVEVESVEGEGTTFRVTIPTGKEHLSADQVRVSGMPAPIGLGAGAQPYVEEAMRWLEGTPAEAANGHNGKHDTAAAAASGLCPRILLADDNADMRDYLRHLLTNQGYEVETVADGMAAWMAAISRPPDLVLSDVMMPQLDGFGLLDRLRGDPRTAGIPFILLSARAGEESRVEGLDAGADDYLIKPFSARELIARVRSQLNLAHFRREAIENLRRSDEMFLRLVEASPTAIVVIDGDLVVKVWNRAAETMFGWREGEVLGRTMPIVPELPIDEVTELRDRLAAGEATPGIETLHRTRDGRLLAVRVTAAPLTDAGGRAIASVLLFDDITARKIDERKLAVQHEVARLLARAETLDEIIDPILESIRRNLLWDFGALWLVDEERQVIRCTHTSTAPGASFPAFDGMTRTGAFTKGEGLPGRVWQHGRTFTLPDVAGTVKFPRIEVACADGLRSATAFPIRLGNRVHGVMEFFSRDHRSEPELYVDTADALGAQIAQFMERERARAELRSSEEIYRTVSNTAADAIVTIDEENIVLMANPAVEEIFGYRPSDVIGRKITMLMPERFRSMHEAGVARFLTEGAASFSWKGVEVIGLHRSGREFPIEVSFGTTRHDGKHWFTGIIRDVTARRDAERMLREAKERYELVNRATNDVIWDRDLATNALYWNEAVEPTFGYRQEEIPSTTEWWAEHAHPDDRDRIRAEIRDVIERGDSFWTGEYRFRVKDGSYRIFLDRGFIARDDSGKAYRMIGSMHDVTERKQIERQLETVVEDRTAKLRETISELEAFSYTVSHDLRAPLRAIQGYAQILDEEYGDELDETARHYLSRIVNGGRRLDLLIQDVLTYSRVARSEFELMPVDLESLVDDIIQAYPAFQSPRATIELERPLHDVAAHPSPLTQCISNLFGNAVKFVPEGTLPHIRVRTEQIGEEIVIWIEDNGIGIRPEYGERIFGMFERAHDKETYEGTGIGLAIVRKAVEKLGGAIGVESDGENGSRFWIRLNNVRVDNARAGKSA